MIIKAQKVTTNKEAESSEDTLARFCYLYPQYTYAEARKLPYKRINRLIRMARKEQAYEWYNLLRISIAPHGKKGLIDKLFKEYKQVIESQ